eukprot:TRINITY_DN2051_c0_g1_i1.p1 TRINITY_DN2051_c0_g1~~TRINITY_DN2051_c0_g1_i1.p1  ORF type:complete len:197 (+),score=23.01 TRINITY_DN2051_c0_g1_i1:265-855(+)
MRTPKQTSFFSTTVTTTTAFLYIGKNYQNAPPGDVKTIEVSIQFPAPVSESDAAVKIQSAYRSHRVRTLVRKIWAVKSEADRFERLIQQQETVDAVRTDEREKLRMNEKLMSMLLQLDSVPGICPSVRDLRRWVSRRIVVLQEVLDAVADTQIAESDGFLTSWDEMFKGTEERVCEGGEREKEFECCLESFLMMGV